MCVGFPARVLSVSDTEAYVDAGDGQKRKASLAAPEAIRRGDYVLMYANLIVNKIDRTSALETVRTMRDLAIGTAEEEGLSTEEASRPFDERLRGLSSRATPSSDCNLHILSGRSITNHEKVERKRR